MARCEDFPCCGHEAGDCPSHDKDGNERWTCVSCGKILPLKASRSICPKCQRRHARNNWADSYDDHDHSMDY